MRDQRESDSELNKTADDLNKAVRGRVQADSSSTGRERRAEQQTARRHEPGR